MHQVGFNYTDFTRVTYQFARSWFYGTI